MSKFSLKYFQDIEGKPAWFRRMSLIGPQLTTKPEEAAIFESRIEACRHPAALHPICLLEVVPAPEASNV